MSILRLFGIWEIKSRYVEELSRARVIRERECVRWKAEKNGKVGGLVEETESGQFRLSQLRAIAATLMLAAAVPRPGKEQPPQRLTMIGLVGDQVACLSLPNCGSPP